MSFPEISTSTTLESPVHGDYTCLLDSLECPYIYQHPYLLSGTEAREGAPILYLSTVISEARVLLKKVIPLLKKENVSFKIPATLALLNDIVNGNLGYDLLGKAVIIFPTTKKDSTRLEEILIRLTAQFKGPEIPTALHVEGIVYRDVGRAFRPQKQKKILGKHFVTVNLIKNDAKGRVLKCLNTSSWRKVNWCLVKEGKRWMCSDEEGRDIRDRLRSQYELQQRLGSVISVPRSIDFFEEKGNAYFVMEYIEGSSLPERIFSLFEKNNWHEMGSSDKLRICGWLMQVVENLDRMHSRGFIHRDLNPHNFLISRENRIYLIDLELCYSSNCSNPPFSLGTYGFMSPAQLAGEIPSIADDIYGLGALMIFLLTGLYPTRFTHNFSEVMVENLNYFLRDSDMTGLIISCLSTDPEGRPGLQEIKDGLLSFVSRITEPTIVEEYEKEPERYFLESVIKKSIRALSTGIYCNSHGLWLSPEPGNQQQVANESIATEINPGFEGGVAGILWLLREAERAGFDTGSCRDMAKVNTDWLEVHGRKFRLEEKKIPKKMLHAKRHFQGRPVLNSFQVSGGLAGLGEFFLEAWGLTGDPEWRKKAAWIANIFLHTWIPGEHESLYWLPDHRRIPAAGLLTGSGGIIHFLMRFANPERLGMIPQAVS